MLRLCFGPFVRRKLQQRLTEAEETLGTTESKYSSLEKTKARIAAELEDINLDLEKVNYHVLVGCFRPEKY